MSSLTKFIGENIAGRLPFIFKTKHDGLKSPALFSLIKNKRKKSVHLFI
jgi:hypothetical protein